MLGRIVVRDAPLEIPGCRRVIPEIERRRAAGLARLQEQLGILRALGQPHEVAGELARGPQMAPVLLKRYEAAQDGEHLRCVSPRAVSPRGSQSVRARA